MCPLFGGSTVYLRQPVLLVMRGLDATRFQESKLRPPLPCPQLLPGVEQGVSEGGERIEIHQHNISL